MISIEHNILFLLFITLYVFSPIRVFKLLPVFISRKLDLGTDLISVRYLLFSGAIIVLGLSINMFQVGIPFQSAIYMLATFYFTKNIFSFFVERVFLANTDKYLTVRTLFIHLALIVLFFFIHSLAFYNSVNLGDFVNYYFFIASFLTSCFILIFVSNLGKYNLIYLFSYICITELIPTLVFLVFFNT